MSLVGTAVEQIYRLTNWCLLDHAARYRLADEGFEMGGRSRFGAELGLSLDSPSAHVLHHSRPHAGAVWTVLDVKDPEAATGRLILAAVGKRCLLIAGQ
jgi:hypothetical protein